MGLKSRNKAEFGDFQTPPDLAAQACALLHKIGVEPVSIIEPTCGKGSFLKAALDHFPGSKHALGADINASYISEARESVKNSEKVEFVCQSFFTTAWAEIFKRLPDPILLVGNPPWVTNAHLGALDSDNLPEKKNFQKHSGLDALTGKSNFDISEWMLLHQLEWLQGKEATIAVLCKTAVARKVLSHAWKNKLRVHDAALYLIDAALHFDAAVDACFFVIKTNHAISYDCRVFRSFDETEPIQTFGYRDSQLVSEVSAYDAWKGLQGTERYKWRSGIKHDCSRVMELTRSSEYYRNGFEKIIELEDAYLYPMLKSSDLAAGKVAGSDRFMIVPQKAIGEETDSIAEKAPRTWRYLQKHAEYLDSRGSIIYKKRPRFSIFGVGPYSFAPWKVAISAFYKSLEFRIVGPIQGKPVVFDDTVNFIPCRTQDEAICVAKILNAYPAREFLKAHIFWDTKRPLTVDILKRIDILRAAEKIGMQSDIEQYISEEKPPDAQPQISMAFAS